PPPRTPAPPETPFRPPPPLRAVQSAGNAADTLGMDASGGPIHSHFEDDPSHADAIEAFVVALAERVDALQDNEAGGDWPRLLAGAEELARAARQAGYPQLVE